MGEWGRLFVHARVARPAEPETMELEASSISRKGSDDWPSRQAHLCQRDLHALPLPPARRRRRLRGDPAAEKQRRRGRSGAARSPRPKSATRPSRSSPATRRPRAQGPREPKGAAAPRPTGADGQNRRARRRKASTARRRPRSGRWSKATPNRTPTFVAKQPGGGQRRRLGEAPGVYTVNFDRDVSACAYSVTPVDTLEMVSVDTAKVTESNPNGVGIQFIEGAERANRRLRDTQFSIAVFC